MIYFLMFIQIVQPFFQFISVVMCVVGFVGFISCVDDCYGRKIIKKLSIPYLICLFVSLLLSTAPTLDDVTKLKISMLKYEMVTPQNLQSSIDTINRIEKELENKYLKDNKNK